jgi:hypothetical protein
MRLPRNPRGVAVTLPFLRPQSFHLLQVLATGTALITHTRHCLPWIPGSLCGPRRFPGATTTIQAHRSRPEPSFTSSSMLANSCTPSPMNGKGKNGMEWKGREREKKRWFGVFESFGCVYIPTHLPPCFVIITFGTFSLPFCNK